MRYLKNLLLDPITHMIVFAAITPMFADFMFTLPKKKADVQYVLTEKLTNIYVQIGG